MNLETFNRQFVAGLPDAPGVYFFLDGKGDVLYIGKATSLKDRVRSYFASDIFVTRGAKIARMLELAEGIRFERTDSALEALLLEAELIKKHDPPYNTDVKDDKSWNMVVITKEKFPRVLVVRGKKIQKLKSKNQNSKGKIQNEGERDDRNQTYKICSMFGPFPSGASLREAMKIVRRIFPFRDTCTPLDDVKQKKDMDELAWNTSRQERDVDGPARPASRRRRDAGGCFNSTIGLCPGMCAGKISAREYAKTVRNIELFFEGKKMKLVQHLEREMKREAKALRFERANEIKQTLFALSHIRDIALLSRDFLERERMAETFRIEGYDVAHLGGTETVGVMTVVENGRIATSEYRKFLIRSETKGNDFAALEELLRRRFGHAEWAFPGLIVVDGSHLQRRVAERVLAEFGADIPIVSVVKDERHRPKGILGPKKERDRFKDDILLANAEAHRFAISFHRKRRGKSFLEK